MANELPDFIPDGGSIHATVGSVVIWHAPGDDGEPDTSYVHATCMDCDEHLIVTDNLNLAEELAEVHDC